MEGSFHTEVSFATIGYRDLVLPDVIELARGSGFALKREDAPRTLPALNQLLKRRPISFVVASAAPDRMSLVDSTAITAVHVPPMILVHRDPMPPDVQEKMRRAGVAALCQEGSPPEVMAALVGRLARSWSWVRVPLGHIDVAGAIQSVAELEQELCVSVACPHVSPLMSEPWTSLRPCTAQPDAQGPQVGANGRPKAGGSRHNCRGWFGRIYIQSGSIVFAETPQEQGIAALATMLELKSGQVCCQDVLLRPPAANVGMRLDAALLEAASRSDHRSAGIPMPEAQEEEFIEFDTIDECASQPISIDPPTNTSLTETILRAANDLRGVAICDAQGWVQTLSGALDAETICAVVTMSVPQIRRAAGLVGMGQVRQWAVSSRKATIYASLTATGAIAAVGEPTLNPAPILRAMDVSPNV